jgi:hypothetical protein
VRAKFFLTLLAVACGAYSQQPSPSPAESAHNKKPSSADAKQTTNEDKRGSNESPLIISGNVSSVVKGEITTIKTSEETANESNYHEQKASDERIALILTVISLGVSIILTVITGLLARFTWKLWTETGKVVSGAEDTAKRQLRAYVSVEPKEVRFLSPEYSPGITILLKNHGSTPARKVTHKSEIAVLPNPLPAAFKFTYSPESEDRTPFVLFPEQPRESIKARPTLLTAVEITNLGNGTNFRLYFYGLVGYVDSFGLPQTTTYCIFMEGTAATKAREVFASTGQTSAGRWIYAETYNEAT